MNPNQVSATFPTADQEAVMAAITTIRQKLPFLIDLTLGDRKTLVKFGDKSEAFVRKAIEVAALNPTMLPVSFDLDAIRKDAQLFDDLAPIRLTIDQLQKQLDDTAMKAGSQAYAAARTIYASTKSNGGAALETATGELRQRFTRKGKGASSTTAAPPPLSTPNP